MTGRPAGKLALESTGAIIVEHLFVADTFWSRLCGLQFRRRLPVGTGLLLKPSRGIHSFWMRFPIDVLFLSENGTVLEIRRSFRPWRVAIPVQSGVACVLEVAAGPGVADVGDRVVHVGPGGAANLFRESPAMDDRI